MADEKSRQVEKYKYTDETKAFLKQLQELNRVKKALEMEGLIKQRELQSILDMYKDIRISYDGMISNQPTRKLNEIPGMRFNDEGGEESPDVRIKY